MRAGWKAFRDILALLPSKARNYIISYSIALGALAILDAASLGILAVIITPLVAGTHINLPILGPVDSVGLLILLGVVCLLMILKGFLSVLLIWFASRKFAKYEVEVGNSLFDAYLNSSWTYRLTKNSADIVRIADVGIAQVISGFLMPASTLLGEALTFVAVLAVLAVAQPVIAIIALVYLAVIGWGIFYWISKRAQEAGRVRLRTSLTVSRLLTEMVGALKEITLRNKIIEVTSIVRKERQKTAIARANIQFLSTVPRYVMEAALVGGFVVVGLTGYVIGGLVSAVTAISLFALAGFRMTPSIQRFQNISTLVISNIPIVNKLIDDIREAAKTPRSSTPESESPLDYEPSALVLDQLQFSYANNDSPVLSEISLRIPFPSSAAIVGPSGAGKSTLVDLILGLLEPTSGEIRVDETPLPKVSTGWRSRVGYVPQEVTLFDGTVAQNVALSWSGEIDEDQVRRALSRAQLLETIETRPEGIHGRVGERGINLSGGQRQRLGIARALYTDPLILVMDEATSSLDTTTEAAITDAIHLLKGKVTTITVAHRLSTIKDANQIFYLSEGRLVSSGTFDEVRRQVPQFAEQARLAGFD
ncbi:MAG: ABC transporter ATP-binding protein [Cryobacterium sp.]|nr:ABC transporter ATP-binding protein [Cryobacterium sp.]MCO5294617.1 ABC transporter ATP-binding protein/permease [Homoserinimonas sp.]